MFFFLLILLIVLLDADASLAGGNRTFSWIWNYDCETMENLLNFQVCLREPNIIIIMSMLITLHSRGPRRMKECIGLKDWHLVLIVFTLILVDVILLLIYTTLEGFLSHFQAGIMPNEENPSGIYGVSIVNLVYKVNIIIYILLEILQELEIKTEFMTYNCSTNHWIRRILIGILHLYKGVLHVCALFFAFKTRKVKIDGLNNTKYITAIVYTTSITTAITAISLLTVMNYINVYAFIYSFGFWLSNSLLLGLLLLPKVVL